MKLLDCASAIKTGLSANRQLSTWKIPGVTASLITARSRAHGTHAPVDYRWAVPRLAVMMAARRQL